MTATSDVDPGFASLAELQLEHARLVKRVGKGISLPVNLKKIDEFVRKSVATGTVLDAPTDRAAAQSLISFWVTRLATASRDSSNEPGDAQIPEFEDTLLAEFDSDAFARAVITPTDLWLDQQPELERTLTKRLVLRLVALREDGKSFDVVSGASAVCEGLEPQNRAQEILARLLELGVVRCTRNPTGNEEFALGSAELLSRWPSLVEWMAKRREFRERATNWAQRRSDKESDQTKWPFWRRVGNAFDVAFQTFGDWVDRRWQAVLIRLKLYDRTDKFPSEPEYEEAEAYRDKNAVEFRLVYQKRQHDKERQAKRKARAVVFGAAAILFAILAFLAYRGRSAARTAEGEARKAEGEARKAEGEARKAEENERIAKQREEIAKKRADLHVADLYYEKSIQREADDRDFSGAFLWYASALSKFNASADALDPAEQERLRASYLLQFATARERLPKLSGMAYHKQMITSARTPDGKYLLTVGADEPGKGAVRFWRWREAGGHAEWVSSSLSYEQAPTGQTLGQRTAYISFNGRFAALSGHPKGGNPAVYMWEIPENGTEKSVVKLKGLTGDIVDAGFSPDGQLFAIVSQLGNKSYVNLWRSERWDAEPIPLKVPDEVGPLGRLAFCPTSQNNRLAVAVASVQPATLYDRVICLEWSLSELRVEPPLRRYSSMQRFPMYSQDNEIQTFVTYKQDGNRLLVADSLQNNPWAFVWILDSSKKDWTTEKPIPSSQFLYSSGPVSHAAFSRWDDRLVIVSADGSAALWSLQSSGPRDEGYYRITNILKHKARIFKAEFSPDGQYVVTGSRDYRALVWHTDTGQLAHPSFHHGESVTDAGFTDDGSLLISSSRDLILRWDLTREASRPLAVGAVRGVRSIVADPEQNLLVTAGEHEARSEQLTSAGWARAWSTVNGDPASPELQHPSPVLHAAISGPGPVLVSTVASDGKIRLWDARSGRELWSEKPAEGMAVYTAFGHGEGGLRLLALIRGEPLGQSNDSHLRIYRLNSQGERVDGIQTFRYLAPFTMAAFSPKCHYAIAYTGNRADKRGEAVVWDTQSGAQKVLKGSGKRGTAHDDAITHAAFSGDGDHLVTTGRDDKAFVWDMRDGKYRELLAKQDDEDSGQNEDTGHTGDIEFASFDRTGTRIATAGADGWAIVWEQTPDRSRFRLVQKLKNEWALTHAVFASDPRYLLTADTAGTTRAWDVKDRRTLTTELHPGQTILQLVQSEADNGDASVYVIGNLLKRGPLLSNRPGQRPNSSAPSPSVGLNWPMVTQWRLNSAASPGKGDTDLAEWTASRRVNEAPVRTDLTLLTQDAIEQLWRDTNPHPNLVDRTSSENVGKWHEREAALCEIDGRWQPAIEHWKHAIDKNTSKDRRSNLLARRARAYGEMNEWNLAELDLDEALEKGSPSSELWQARADVRFQRNLKEKDPSKLKQAIGDYQQALKANKENGTARAQLAAAFVQSGEYNDAIANYDEALRRDAKNPDLLNKRAVARTRLDKGVFEPAYNDYLAAGQLFKDQRRLDEATGAYSAALVLFKDGVGKSPKLEAKVRAELADVEMKRAEEMPEGTPKQNIYIKARDQFLEATKRDANSWAYWSGLAHCYERLAQWKEARDGFQMALKLNDGDSALTASWTNALVQLREWDKAAKAILVVINREPKILSHRLRLAAIYLQPIPPAKEARPDRLEAARACLVDAAADDYFSQQSILWLRLAVVQLALGRVDDYKAVRARMLQAYQNPLADDANNAAWASVFTKDSPEGIKHAIELAAKAVSLSPRSANFLNTYGAVLCRADKPADAIEKLDEATKQRALGYLDRDQLAYGNALDLLFKALAQYTPKDPRQARQTWNLALDMIKGVESAQKTETPEFSIFRVWERLEFEVLRRETDALINPP